MPYQFAREPLTTTEADQLANACETLEDRLVIWTLLDTGLRVSELCALTRESIQWQEKAMRIKGKGGAHGKGNKHRVVPMSLRVRTLLDPYFTLHERWFAGERQMQKIVKRVANRAGIRHPVTPHVLRHTWATTALQKGLSLPTVQKILGHNRLTTTAIYLNFTDTHVLEEFARKW